MAVTYFGQNDDGNGHAARSLNYLKAIRFQNTAGAGNITELGINFYAGFTGNVRLGVYADTGSATQPGSRLLDAGEITNPVTGWNSITGLSLAVNADAYYWLVWNNGANADAYHNTGYNLYYLAATYGPLPTTIDFPTAQAVRTSFRAGVESGGPLSVGAHRSTTMIGSW